MIDIVRQEFLIAIIALSILLVAFLLIVGWYRYGEIIRYFLKWVTKPRPAKVPQISCYRCQSASVMPREYVEGRHLWRIFWCNDCGYEWFHMEPYRREPKALKTAPPQTEVK